MTTIRIPLSRIFTMPLLIATLSCSSFDAPAEDPVVEPEPVVITNTSAAVWTGLSVSQGGAPLCALDLDAGATVLVVNGTCQVVAAPAAPDAAPPAAETPAVAPASGSVAAPAAAVTPKVLKGRATVSGGFGPARRIGVFNDSGYSWTSCKVVLNGEWSYVGPTRLESGGHEGIMGQRFTNASGDIMVKNHQIRSVRVSCAEGTGTFTP